MTATKVCSKCGEEKPLELFYKRVDSKDGKRGACKECDKPRLQSASKKYREKYPERHAAKFKSWAERNKQYNKERWKKYAEENAEKLKEKRQKDYWDDPEKYRQRSNKWGKQNREKINSYARIWIKTRPDIRQKANEASRRATAKAIDNLTDTYVKAVIVAGTTIPRGAIPISMIEAKRIQLQIKRFLKERKQ